MNRQIELAHTRSEVDELALALTTTQHVWGELSGESPIDLEAWQDLYRQLYLFRLPKYASLDVVRGCNVLLVLKGIEAVNHSIVSLSTESIRLAARGAGARPARWWGGESDEAQMLYDLLSLILLVRDGPKITGLIESYLVQVLIPFSRRYRQLTGHDYPYQPIATQLSEAAYPEDPGKVSRLIDQVAQSVRDASGS